MGRTALVVVALGVAGLVAGFFIARLIDDRSGPAIVIEDPVADATIVVSIEGAVATPGVQTLPGDARMQDALTAAGGARPEADLSGVNLAARVRDEERIVVPWRPAADPTAVAGGTEVGEAPVAAAVTPTAAPSGGAAASEGSAARINVNTATIAELETLPGIGEAKARAIVDYREANGPFASVDELAEVAGISPRMVEGLRPYVTV